MSVMQTMFGGERCGGQVMDNDVFRKLKAELASANMKTNFAAKELMRNMKTNEDVQHAAANARKSSRPALQRMSSNSTFGSQSRIRARTMSMEFSTCPRSNSTAATEEASVMTEDFPQSENTPSDDEDDEDDIPFLDFTAPVNFNDSSDLSFTRTRSTSDARSRPSLSRSGSCASRGSTASSGWAALRGIPSLLSSMSATQQKSEQDDGVDHTGVVFDDDGKIYVVNDEKDAIAFSYRNRNLSRQDSYTDRSVDESVNRSRFFSSPDVADDLSSRKSSRSLGARPTLQRKSSSSSVTSAYSIVSEHTCRTAPHPHDLGTRTGSSSSLRTASSRPSHMDDSLGQSLHGSTAPRRMKSRNNSMDMQKTLSSNSRTRNNSMDMQKTLSSNSRTRNNSMDMQKTLSGTARGRNNSFDMHRNLSSTSRTRNNSMDLNMNLTCDSSSQRQRQRKLSADMNKTLVSSVSGGTRSKAGGLSSREMLQLASRLDA